MNNKIKFNDEWLKTISSDDFLKSTDAVISGWNELDLKAYYNSVVKTASNDTARDEGAIAGKAIKANPDSSGSDAE
jgi:hypothetical protein